MKKICLIPLFLVCMIYAGSVEFVKTNREQSIYAILPECDSASSDTCGPIDISSSEYFSIVIRGLYLTGLNNADTSVFDSGFTVIPLISNNEDGTELCNITSDDSTITINSRAKDYRKGLTLDAGSFLYFVITRTDTDTNMLDFKNRAGIASRKVFQVTLIKK